MLNWLRLKVALWLWPEIRHIKAEEDSAAFERNMEYVEAMMAERRARRVPSATSVL